MFLLGISLLHFRIQRDFSTEEVWPNPFSISKCPGLQMMRREENVNVQKRTFKEKGTEERQPEKWSGSGYRG